MPCLAMAANGMLEDVGICISQCHVWAYGCHISSLVIWLYLVKVKGNAWTHSSSSQTQKLNLFSVEHCHGDLLTWP